MANQWAITIGISQYTRLNSLRFAKYDAAALRDFWVREARFEQVYYFADDSPDTTVDAGVKISTQPTLDNLKRFLQVRFATPFLKPEDTLWFFFSGHGLNSGNRDYLLPIDADPEFLDETALAIEDIAACLRQSGTERIVLLLDACRSEEQQFGQGFGTDPEGVIALYATDFNQISRELAAEQQGAFTCALMDGFRPQGRYRGGTFKALHQFLTDRLPKLTLNHGEPRQTPRLHADVSVPLEEIRIPQVTPKLPGLKPVVGVGATIGLCLVGGLGYWGYQALSRASSEEAILPKVSQPAGAGKPTPKSPVSIATNPRNGLTDAATQSRVPKPGTYYTTNPAFSGARREIIRSGDRLCVKMVDSAPSPDQPAQVIVSSLAVRADGAYVDATKEKLQPDSSYSEITDGSGIVWQRLARQATDSEVMSNCLASNAVFVQRDMGE